MCESVDWLVCLFDINFISINVFGLSFCFTDS